MSNSSVITKEAQADTLRDITKAQEATLENCINELVKIKEAKKITESNWRALTNVLREIDALRELFTTRLFNSLKRGDMITG